MLQGIRDRTQGWIAGVIISLLILSFGLWGIHSYFVGGGVNSTVAEVNGVEITKSQLGVAYERLRRQVQASNYDITSNAEAGLKTRALQSLIDLQVLKQASLKQDYRISNGQVDSFLESMPEFQVNGQFSITRFQQVLSLSLYSASDFLDLIKTSLLIDQPRLGTIFTSFALPYEIDQSIALVNQERKVRYTVVPFAIVPIQSIQVPEEKINAYYEAHQDEFKTPEQVSIEYIAFSMKDITNNILPTEQELQDYYKDNLQNNASQTFEQAKPQLIEAVKRQKAEEQFTEIREKLASSSYEHPENLQTSSQLLNLPVKTSELFSKDKPGKDIAQNNKVREAAFSNDVLNLKNNSDVIQLTSDSVAVIRVKQHQLPSTQSLDTVRSQIVDKLTKEVVNEKTFKIAEEIVSKLKSNTESNQVLLDNHLNWNSVGWIARMATSVNPAILEAAFDMPIPENADHVTYQTTRLSDGYGIIALDEVRDGKLANKDDYKVFAEQIQNTQGLLEYELYKQSVVDQAKIVAK